MATQNAEREYEIPPSIVSNVVIDKIKDFATIQAMNPAILQVNRSKAFNTLSFIKAIPSDTLEIPSVRTYVQGNLAVETAGLPETLLKQERWGSDPLAEPTNDIVDVPGGTLASPQPPPIIQDTSEASLLELPIDIRDKAIESYLKRRNRLTLPILPIMEEKHPSECTITEFNKKIALGSIFKKWKNGIPIWCKVKHSVGKLKPHSSVIQDQLISNLLKAKIIEKTKSGAFVSNFFLVSKENNSMFDYTSIIEIL